ncbi:TPA: hypothetical protein DCQ44_03035 [Candidatus Taylorbacteria bacterium]|nr:hypothetical protein [Candidatus Taylorbacteria bacterium]
MSDKYIETDALSHPFGRQRYQKHIYLLKGDTMKNTLNNAEVLDGEYTYLEAYALCESKKYYMPLIHKMDGLREAIKAEILKPGTYWIDTGHEERMLFYDGPDYFTVYEKEFVARGSCGFSTSKDYPGNNKRKLFVWKSKPDWWPC